MAFAYAIQKIFSIVDTKYIYLYVKQLIQTQNAPSPDNFYYTCKNITF